jgi:hypothetical protein
MHCDKSFPLLCRRVRRGKVGSWGEKMLRDLRIRDMTTEVFVFLETL